MQTPRQDGGSHGERHQGGHERSVKDHVSEEKEHIVQHGWEQRVSERGEHLEERARSTAIRVRYTFSPRSFEFIVTTKPPTHWVRITSEKRAELLIHSRCVLHMLSCSIVMRLCITICNHKYRALTMPISNGPQISPIRQVYHPNAQSSMCFWISGLATLPKETIRNFP